MMKNIYYSLFRSRLIYAIQVWGSAGTIEINTLLVLQKSFLRIITYNDTLPLVPVPLHPTDSLFYKLEILKLQDVFKLQVSKFIFDCLHLYTPANFHNWFALNHHIHSYNTRSMFLDIDNLINSNNLFIVNARTTHYGLKLLKVSGPKIWNFNHIRSKQSIASFQHDVKKHLIAHMSHKFCYCYYYFISIIIIVFIIIIIIIFIIAKIF